MLFGFRFKHIRVSHLSLKIRLLKSKVIFGAIYWLELFPKKYKSIGTPINWISGHHFLNVQIMNLIDIELSLIGFKVIFMKVNAWKNPFLVNKIFKMGNSKVRELLKELVEVFFTTDRLIIAIKLEFHKKYHFNIIYLTASLKVHWIDSFFA